jgi:hypothetical protein
MRSLSIHPLIVGVCCALGVWIGTNEEIANAGVAQADVPATGGSAHGGTFSEWPVSDSDPESSVPGEIQKQRNPLQFGYWLMDVAQTASAATRRGDHAAAIRYYRALAKAVPERSISFTRLCESYEAAGDWQDAVENCSAALTHAGANLRDYTHYFDLLVAKRGSLNAQEISALSSVVEHVRLEPSGSGLADDLDCRLGARIGDVDRLRRCVRSLEATVPGDPKTLAHRQSLDALESAQRWGTYAWGLGTLAIGIGAAFGVAVLRQKKLSRAG